MNAIPGLADQVESLVRARDNLQTELDSANRMIELLRTQHADISKKYTEALRRHELESASLTTERDTAKQRAETIHGILMGTATATMQALRAWRGDHEADKQAALPAPVPAEQPAAGSTESIGAAHNHPALRLALGER